jgi:hypothetical protein
MPAQNEVAGEIAANMAEIVAKFQERRRVREEIAAKFKAERDRASVANLTKARLFRKRKKRIVVAGSESDDEDDEGPVPPASDPSWSSLTRPLLDQLDTQRLVYDEIVPPPGVKRARLRQMLAWLSFNGFVVFRQGYWTTAKSPPREPPPGYGESRSDELPSGSESESPEKTP